ncbi:MAG: hypothetical protein ACKPJO_31135 [Dolichospermum sp.]
MTNNSTQEPIYPPTDGNEIVTISRADFNAIVEKAVSEAVQQFEVMFARAVGEATGGEKWLNTAAAAAVLGKRKEQLRQMVKDGRLRLHEEVRDDRPKRATRPVYMFHIQKCKKRLLTSPEEREINETI